MRRARKPRRRASSRYSSTTALTSGGGTECRSKTSVTGIRTGSSSPAIRSPSYLSGIGLISEEQKADPSYIDTLVPACSNECTGTLGPTSFRSTMKCLSCGQEISLSRRVVGAKFCCAAHREAHNKRSARALRDLEDVDGEDEWSSNAVWRSSRVNRPDRSESGPDRKTTFLGLMAAAFVLLAVMTGAGGGGGGGTARTRSADYTVTLPESGAVSDVL